MSCSRCAIVTSVWTMSIGALAPTSILICVIRLRSFAIAGALLERFGTAERIHQATAEQFAEVPMIGTILARKFADSLREVDVDAEVGRIESAGVRLLALGTPDYPPMLASIEDAPSLLYIRGTLTLADANAVALVGSRHCTDYGRRMATRLATGLARAGVTGRFGAHGEVGADGNVHRISVVPTPYTRPHPPVFVATAGSPESAEYAGRRGFIPLYFTSIKNAVTLGTAYQNAATASGHNFTFGQNQAVVRMPHLGATTEAARKRSAKPHHATA